jgi:predicted DCC family thiol-disulfide oxidoreductase YuxK
MNTNIQATFTTPDAVELPITVYYDHTCKLCRSEIENLSARDELGVLKMIDCSGSNVDATLLPFDQKTLLNCIHALDAKGEWLKATDVFVVCYRAAQLRGIAKIFLFAKPVLERVYPFIARHRNVLSRLGVHRFFNYLTNKSIQRKAKLAMASSQKCMGNECEAALPKN